MDLNSMFPKGKTWASETMARRKLNAFEAKLPKEGDTGDPKEYHGYCSVIVPVGQGNTPRFQVIVVMGERCTIPPLWFIDAGFCVTNV